MRLRDLTASELVDVASRRQAVREALARIDAPWKPDASAIDAAPFLTDWSTRPYPGTGRTCLKGLCWGHPVLGDTIVTTSAIEHQGPGYAVTSNRIYVLGAENRMHKRERILSGRRGRFRPPQRAEVPEAEAIDEVKL